MQGGLGNYVAFLSCLCGSERNYYSSDGCRTFLSCLCGSERGDSAVVDPAYFLSCLCGSELEKSIS